MKKRDVSVGKHQCLTTVWENGPVATIHSQLRLDTTNSLMYDQNFIFLDLSKRIKFKDKLESNIDRGKTNGR